jgi:putative ABC transport system substrate-binding protein
MSRPADARVAPAANGGRDRLMDRRAVIGGLALVTLAAPRAASAQAAPKVYRIGILALPETSDLVGPQPRSPVHNSLVRGLRELGYVYGEHFVTEPRGAPGKPERFPTLAAELIRLKVDVIVAAGPALPALKQATSTIPIVMGGSADPVGLGYIQSLGHPGGNFTGLSAQGLEVIGKRPELLKEIVPSAAAIAVFGIRPASQIGRPPKPPRGSGAGNCCRSRFEMLARSRGPS